MKRNLVQYLTELPLGFTDHIIKLHMQFYQRQFMTIISIYMPTLVSPQNETITFYDDFRIILRHVDKDELVLPGQCFLTLL